MWYSLGVRYPSFPEYLSRPRSRKTFLGYFLSITTLCGLAIIASTTFSYAAFEREIVYQLDRQNRAELERVGAVFTSTHAGVVPNTLQLLLNPTINRLLYTRSATSLDIARANAVLDQAKLGNPHIESIVVYSYVRQTFYSTEHGPMSTNAYHDSNLVETLSEARNIHMYRFIPRNVRNEPILSVIVGSPTARDQSLKGAIVTNISERRLRALIEANRDIQGSTLIVADTDGRILSHKNVEQFGDSLAQSELWSRVQDEPSSEGTFIMNLEGTETAVSFLVHQPMNWYILFTTPTDYLFGRVRKTRNQIILFTGLSVVGTAMLAMLLAMWIYGPFERLRSAATQLAFDFLETPPKAVDALEIHYLDRLLRQIHDEAVSKAEETRAIKKRDVLKSLLLGYAPETLSETEIGDYALQPDEGIIRVIVCRLDYVAQLRKNGGDAAISSQRCIVRELAHTLAISTAVVEAADDHIVLVVPDRDDKTDEHDGGRTIISDLRELSSLVTTETGKSITCGISHPVTHVRDLHNAYLHALQATDNRFCNGRGKVFQVENETVRDKTFTTTVPEKTTRMIIQMARGGDVTNAVGTVRKLAENFEHYTFSEFTFATQYILYEIEQAFRNSGSDGTASANKLHDLRVDTEWLETVNDMITETDSALNRLKEISETVGGRKTRDLIERVRHIIESEFADLNLSAKEIAARMGVSTNYLRQTFRDNEGHSINDYITAIRLKYATMRLETTCEPVQAIHEQSGFANYNYFFRKFRESFGMTPLEYRRRFFTQNS